jgi:hypothetical protein
MTATGPQSEEHYLTLAEIAAAWRISDDTARRIFEREPGVLVIETAAKRGRRYRTIRIPASVAERVHTRMSNRCLVAHK